MMKVRYGESGARSGRWEVGDTEVLFTGLPEMGIMELRSRAQIESARDLIEEETRRREEEYRRQIEEDAFSW